MSVLRKTTNCKFLLVENGEEQREGNEHVQDHTAQHCGPRVSESLLSALPAYHTACP